MTEAIRNGLLLRARMLDLRVHKETKEIGEEPSAPVRNSSRREATR